MRGSRVKNIIIKFARRENRHRALFFRHQRIHSGDALSPAEVSQMQIITDEQKVNIIVAEDQLSLAIGKYGQNVRLASKLVAWELDI